MRDYSAINGTIECGPVPSGRALILLSGKRLRRISRRCAPIFALRPMTWAAGLSALIIVSTMLPLVLSEDRFLPRSVIEQALGVAIALITLVGHELGHAAAASRYGHQPLRIGLTLHRRVLPAMFADIWRRGSSNRNQIIAMALAGCTAQLPLAAFLCMPNLIFPSAIGALSVAVLATVGLTFAQLIPCYGSDGEIAIASFRNN